jgi:uncharacterized protein (TIGR00255 family)
MAANPPPSERSRRLQSMTGFGRADGVHGALRWHWEARSVNGRGLDVRLRLPPGYEGLEQRAREAVSQRAARGSITINLVVQRDTAPLEIRLNERAVEQVHRAVERLQALTGASAPTADAYLTVRGVLEFGEPIESETETKARDDAVIASLAVALDALLAARLAEGDRLGAALEAHIALIEARTAAIAASPSRTPDAIARRLGEQIARLAGATSALDPDRLHQEAMLLATRADIEEELERLRSHLAAARDLIASREPAGRKLDFLTQEFNREANTLCAKSSDSEITRLGLDIKAAVDQLREQVQNIE